MDGPKRGLTDRISHILYCLGIPKAELDKHLKKKSLAPAPEKSR